MISPARVNRLFSKRPKSKRRLGLNFAFDHLTVTSKRDRLTKSGSWPKYGQVAVIYVCIEKVILTFPVEMMKGQVGLTYI